MGSSLILKGGASTPKTVLETIVRANSFVSGDVVRYDPSVGAAGTWYRSQANSAESAEVVGVVQSASATSFDVVYSGFISLSGYAGVSAPVLFLSAEVPGGLTSSPPSALGTVVKPVLTRTTTGGGYVVTNYLGTQIGGSSTISVDEIQPVGTIMPFAGSVIPDTWLECTGASYAVVDYPELYLKLQNTSGDRVPAYGYVATLTVTGNVGTSLSVGDYIQYKANTAAFTGTGSPFAGAVTNASLLAIVLSVTSTTVVVQVIPSYSSTTKNFTINNTVFAGGSFVSAETGTGNYRAYSNASAFKAVSLTISTVAITHFNTPDLRGRFAIGVNASALPASGDLETDTSNNSAISGIYSLGSEGGQESTVVDTAGVLTGTTNSKYTTTSGSNTGLLSNMPPYTVVRYIIKAKPYTRAAIIDDIDIPYGNLLIRDLRTRLLGGSNSDLVFHTNTSGDSGLGTERMRLTSAGNLGIGTDVPASPLSVCVTSGGGLEIVPAGGSSITQAYNRATAQYIENVLRGSVLSFYTGQTTTERMRIDAEGNVGIGTSTPVTTLDITNPSTRTTLTGTSQFGGLHFRQNGINDGYVGFTTSATSTPSTTQGGILIQGSGLYGTKIHFLTTDAYVDGMKNRMTVDNLGRVGIGTSAPARNLAIVAADPILQLAATSGYGATRGLVFSLQSNNAQMWNYEAGYMRFGTNDTERMIISSAGDVGVGGSASTSYKFSVTGKIYASDDIVAFSDARYKRDISPIADSLNKVRSLVGVLYTDSNGNRKTGLLAQDVQTVLPEAVSTDEAGNLALAYGNLVGLLVEAVKELTTRVHELEKR